jgi:small subunit ribosomal protein S16
LTVTFQRGISVKNEGLFVFLDLSLRFDIMDCMLAIKLQRIGKKHQPSYRVVVAEKRSKMAAPPVEDLGAYDPRTKATTVKKERVLHWVKMGAQPTVTAHNLLVKQGTLTGAKIAVKMPKAVAKAPATEKAEPVAEVVADTEAAA